MEVNFRKLYFVAICLACLCWGGPDASAISCCNYLKAEYSLMYVGAFLAVSFLMLLICVIQVLRKEKVVNACLEIGVYLIVLGSAICASWIRLPARILAWLFQDG